MPDIDKEAVRRDYEAGMATRAIALKYGCGKSVISKWAKKEGWVARGRVDACPRPAPTTRQRPADEGAEDPDTFHVLNVLAAKLLVRVGETLTDPAPINARDLRSLASTLLDIRQLLHAVSPIEEEEQRLRIDAMRRQIETASGSEPVTVRFVDTEGAEI